jgi:DNA-binding XRE family transcriptional regulator
MSRYVRANGEAIEKARKELGWDVAALATTAGFSKKTIIKLEKSCLCEVFTLSAVADALGKSMPEVMADETEPAKALQAFFLPKLVVVDGKKYIDVYMRVPIPHEDFDESESEITFATVLGNFMDTPRPIEPRGATPGRTIIRLGMTAEDADYFIAGILRWKVMATRLLEQDSTSTMGSWLGILQESYIQALEAIRDIDFVRIPATRGRKEVIWPDEGGTAVETELVPTA